jgi:hypothetical protein
LATSSAATVMPWPCTSQHTQAPCNEQIQDRTPRVTEYMRACHPGLSKQITVPVRKQAPSYMHGGVLCRAVTVSAAHIDGVKGAHSISRDQQALRQCCCHLLIVPPGAGHTVEAGRLRHRRGTSNHLRHRRVPGVLRQQEA